MPRCNPAPAAWPSPTRSSRRFSASSRRPVRRGGVPAARAFRGVPVLVSAGPTWEAWDAIRIITNRSTGAMGYAIAEAFRDAGSRVTLVSGPVDRPAPGGVHMVRVESARQMLTAMLRESRKARIIVGTAAVVDYRPAHVSTGKMKKTHGSIAIRLVRNPDILATLGRRKRPGQILVGFALETSRILPRAREKLRAKNLDYILANRPWMGRRRTANTVWFLSGGGGETWRSVSRAEAARRLVGRLRPDVTKNTLSFS